MRNMLRQIAFILASTGHGAMIVNRHDRNARPNGFTYGVGHQILETGGFDTDEVALALRTLALRRAHHGDGVVAIDCGANIGVHTIEWANAMTGWGSVLAIEAQERVFYALAGNIAINNCFNARALNVAVSAQGGAMRIPVVDHTRPASFGSLELKGGSHAEFIGQAVDYSDAATVEIETIALDDLALQRLDFIKMDIERMEMDALQGAAATIDRCRPVILVEALKTDGALLTQWLKARGYEVRKLGINLLAVHATDGILPTVARHAPPPL